MVLRKFSRTLKIALALMVTLFSSGLLPTATAYATTNSDSEKPSICHPVNGSGELGNGWNLIGPDKASSHIDESLYPNGQYWKHESNDGLRHDVYAVNGTCPGAPIAELNEINIPTVPSIDPCGLNNAKYGEVPSGDYSVTRNQDGSITLTASQGFVFPGDKTSVTLPAPVDSGKLCDTPETDSISYCHNENNLHLITTSKKAFWQSGHVNHAGDIFPAGSVTVNGETQSWAAQGDQSLLLTDCQSKPEDKVSYTDWVDSEWECGDKTVTQTRSKTVTPYVFANGSWTLDPAHATTTTETQTRELTKAEQRKCAAPAVCVNYTPVHSTNTDANGWVLGSGASYVPGGMKLSTLGNWQDSTISRPFSGSLSTIGTGYNFSPDKQYLGLHVSTEKGTLVYEKEPSYAGKWWSNSDFGVSPGMGYKTFDTLENIIAENPDLMVTGLTVLYTSPDPASVTLSSVTFGCNIYTFGMGSVLGDDDEKPTQDGGGQGGGNVLGDSTSKPAATGKVLATSTELPATLPATGGANSPLAIIIASLLAYGAAYFLQGRRKLLAEN